ncbi:hypothetical protein HYDPIDRAFT_111900 [Hydnomerulius pinastri MD-312]|uniref:Cleavage/polyadenylation specificity factor A subunit N-terminal domain-containing protein n=1 Tax=Hydnomerulius pinastri MD-312 TaxID=994086 RepID=A0A0C9WF77_9AGAM|nr:hypothetical protein HYDPIDRAFT_111900 [Hydnomerulius pinastri MD-312]
MLQGDLMPLSVMHGSVTLLSSEQLESITRRAARLESDWYDNTVAPRSFKQLRIGRSVTWLRLVYARWLIVASSDTQTSALSCWDLALLTEELTLNNPTTECFLTGPVRSGELRLTSDGGIILAIGVDSRVPAVHVLSFGERDGRPAFSHICELRGFSHVTELSEHLVVCAMKDDVAIPHVVWWRTGKQFPLSTEPEYTGTTITATFWRDYLVIAGPKRLRIFEFSDDFQKSRFVKILPSSLVLLGKSFSWAAISRPAHTFHLTHLTIGFCLSTPRFLSLLCGRPLLFTVFAMTNGTHRSLLTSSLTAETEVIVRHMAS